MADETVQLTFDANLGPFVQQCLKAAGSTAAIEGAQKRLQQVLSETTRKMQQSGKATDDFGKSAAQNFQALDGILSRFGISVSGVQGMLSKLSSPMGLAVAGAAGLTAIATANAAAVKKMMEESGSELAARKDPMKALAATAKTADEAKGLDWGIKALMTWTGKPYNDIAAVLTSAREAGMEFQNPAGDFSVASLIHQMVPVLMTGSFTDASALVKSYGKYKSVFGNKAGSFDQFVAMAGTAAEGSGMEANLAEFVQTGEASMEMMKQLGATPEENLAVFSALARKFKSPEKAARQMNTVISKLGEGVDIEMDKPWFDGTKWQTKQKVAFAGKGLIGGLEEFQKQYPEQYQKAFGEDMGVIKALLEAKDDIKQKTAEAGSMYSQDTDYIARRAARFDAMPHINLQKEKAKAQAYKDLMQEPWGAVQLDKEITDAVYDATQAQRSWFMRGLMGTLHFAGEQTYGRILSPDVWAAARAVANGRWSVNPDVEASFRERDKIVQILQRIAENTGMRQRTEVVPPANPAGTRDRFPGWIGPGPHW